MPSLSASGMPGWPGSAVAACAYKCTPTHAALNGTRMSGCVAVPVLLDIVENTTSASV
jgi:hypothetical protein